MAQVRRGCCKQAARDDGRSRGQNTSRFLFLNVVTEGVLLPLEFLAARDISEVSVRKTEQFPVKDQNTGSSLGHLTVRPQRKIVFRVHQTQFIQKLNSAANYKNR